YLGFPLATGLRTTCKSRVKCRNAARAVRRQEVPRLLSLEGNDGRSLRNRRAPQRAGRSPQRTKSAPERAGSAPERPKSAPERAGTGAEWMRISGRQRQWARRLAREAKGARSPTVSPGGYRQAPCPGGQ